MLRRILWLSVASGVALVLVACGDGTDLPARTLTVVGTEMKFDAPDRVPSGDYDVTFRNDGAAYHELAFVDASGEFLIRRSIAGGVTIVMEVVLEPGTYELACYEPGHYEAGMHKPLVVEEPEAA